MDDIFYQMYLDELALIDPLNGQEEEFFLEEMKKGNLKARERLIEGNLSYALTLAKEYEGRGALLSDLVQEANIALTMAADSYQGDHAFLEQEIRSGLEAFVSVEESELKAEEEILARVNVLKDISQLMAEELDREATKAELAKRMKMTEEEITDIMKLTLEALSVSGE